MRIHLQLVGSTGEVLRDQTFESDVYVLSAARGPRGVADLVHPGLPTTFEVENDGYHAVRRHAAGATRLRRRNRIRITPDLELRLDLYPRPDAVPPVRGACPSRGGGLQKSEVGGAYRSVAREERRCRDCGTAVLSLDGAPSTLGRFTDHSASDWLTVTVANRCPTCTQHLVRSRFQTARGAADVERCPACQLVAIEAEDEAALTGR
jgi:predicted RNA-binding Zn-ribbon protein involved in translation (DUF1610 family)